MKLILYLILAVSIFSGCEWAADGSAPSPPAVTERKLMEILPTEAQAAVGDKNAQFIDVRTREEYSGGHAVNASHFPLDTLERDLAKLDKGKPVYVICETGRRSAAGARILNEAGFGQVYSVSGGTSAWTLAGLPIE